MILKGSFRVKAIFLLIVLLVLNCCSSLNKKPTEFVNIFPDSMLNTKKNVPIDQYPNKTEIETYKKNGDMFFSPGVYNKAYTQYIKALKLAPDNSELYYLAGLSQIVNFIDLEMTCYSIYTAEIDYEKWYSIYTAYYLLCEAMFRGSTKAQETAKEHLNIFTASYNFILAFKSWNGKIRYWEDKNWMENTHDFIFNTE